MPPVPFDAGATPVLDDTIIANLRALRDRVARPGEDVLGELLGLFERDAPARITALRTAVAAGDAKARRDTAHALKGAAANLGARRVVALAAHIEKNEVEGALVERLAEEIEAALAALRVRLA